MSSQWLRSALVATAAALLTVVVGRPVHAELADASGALTRAPYLTDLTAGSIRVNWATATQTTGVVKYGPAGDCTANTVQASYLGTPVLVNGVTQYQHSVGLTGLQPGTTYCYRVYTGGPESTDLLGANPSPQFTTLSPVGSTEPFSFVVFSDSGDTTNSTGDNDGSLNENQASLHAQIATSGARFAIATGDIVHPSGTPTNYGDLNQTGPNVSSFFGPQYWAVPGQSVPLYVATGNHAKNATFLSTFPQTSVAAGSGGVNGLVSYPSYFGSNPGDFATTYYAFSMGNVRFYVLEAAWQDSNVGSADGGACGAYCAKYQVDHAAHWTVDSAQYQWLAADLAAHPGGLKFAFFHFPLRSDDKKQPSSVYLQNTTGSTGSLEELLHDHGVNLVFNGHSHTYQRFVAPPGGVPSYVLGGGGGRLVAVGNVAGGCSTMDAYALGWSYSSGGSACGAASEPTSPAQVHHFVKVTVDGTRVTVMPINALGQAFDVVTYDFAPDTVAPSAPGNLAATTSSSGRVTLTWAGAADNIGVAAYDIYRGGVWLATTTDTARSYVDKSAVQGASYLYEVRARDLAGNTTGATAAVGNPDIIPPSVPANVQASATGPTSVTVSWDPSSDNVGVTTYTVSRDGQPVATTSDTTYVDTGLTPGSTHQYTVSAADADGNNSAFSQPATATTDPDGSPPSVPSGLVVDAVTASSVSLSWGASTDDVGVVRYEVLRDGVLLGSTPLTSFVDTTVAAESTYSYVVRAVDAAGNSSSSSALSVTTLPAWLVFGDGFESGGLGLWNPVAGLEVQSDVVHSGEFAVRQTSSGTATYAYRDLPGGYGELWISGWVYVASRSTSVNLFGFRASTGASIVNVYVDSRGLLSLRNNAGGVTTYSKTVVPVGSWHRVVLHAVVNGSSSSLEVTFDGVVVPELTLTGQNLGTKPIARVQLGETSTGRTYDVIIDDLQVSTVPVG